MTAKARPLLEAMRSLFGGSIKLLRKQTKRWDEAIRWIAWGEDCENALRELLPYLALKKEQARLALTVFEIRRSLIRPGRRRPSWTDEAKARCETIRLRIQELNRKGPEVPLQEPPIPGARLYALRVAGEWVRPQRDLLSDTGWVKLSGAWPSAGIASRNGVVWMLNSSECPRDAVASSLSDILETSPVPPRYFLTPRAAAGILRRAERRERTLPEPLRRALEGLAARSSSTPS